MFHGGRKVVGLSQWRAREGALFSSCAYAALGPAPLLALLDVEDRTRGRAGTRPGAVAAGLAELEPPVAELGRVRAALLDSFTDVSGDGAAGRLSRVRAPALLPG